MYSRRFYGTDRTQRSRPAPTTPQPSFERIEPIKKAAEKSVSEPLPMMALDIPVIEDSEPAFIEYGDPKDFLPKALSRVSVYPEKAPQDPVIPDTQNDSTEDTEYSENTETKESIDTLGGISEVSEESYKTDDIVRSVRNMTFEDIMLTGLLMLGSSGEYDDDIMLVLGLILMIGA